jgi:hypothetical protein
MSQEFTMINLLLARTAENTKVNGKNQNILTSFNNNTYRHKKTGLKDGMGIMFWPDGIKYEG